MAEMYNTTCSSSSSPPEPDDFSLFLHQILRRSSPSSSSSPLMVHKITPPPHTLPQNPHRPIHPSILSGSDRRVPDPISAAESSSAAVFASSGGYFPANVSSSIENDPDEYDCESEEGFEALVGEAAEKSVPARNSSKRSRAAEVHNLSEKRRRSRINEKMKALQNLIPNSNKTDKASMLDEAIEYLKQLQIQVQMLTMRNGLSLYPMCLPGVLQPDQLAQMKMGFYEGNALLDMNMTGMLSVNQDTPTSNLFNIPNQSTNTAQLSVAAPSSIHAETSFSMESTIHGRVRPFQLHTSSEEIRREDMLPCQQLNVDHSETKSLEYQMGTNATISIPYDTKAPDVKDSVLEGCVLGTERRENLLLSNLVTDPILVPNLNCMHSGKKSTKG